MTTIQQFITNAFSNSNSKPPLTQAEITSLLGLIAESSLLTNQLTAFIQKNGQLNFNQTSDEGDYNGSGLQPIINISWTNVSNISAQIADPFANIDGNTNPAGWQPDEETVQRSFDYVKATYPHFWDKIVEQKKEIYQSWLEKKSLLPTDELINQKLYHRVIECNKDLDAVQSSKVTGRVLDLVRKDIGATYKRDTELTAQATGENQ